MRHFFFDTEFIEDGRTIDLLSIGIVDSTGQTYYAEVEDCDWDRADPWVKTHVISQLGKVDAKLRSQIRDEVLQFIGNEQAHFWAYCADYDWVALCQLYGRMIDKPKNFPFYCCDLIQFKSHSGFNGKLPKQETKEHHALNDALWCRDAYNAVERWELKQMGAL